MAALDYSGLLKAIETGAAFRRRQRLQPAGGQGDKIFPPTYPGGGSNSPARHVFETRRVPQPDGTTAEQICVLIDSVQSQANRLEEALEAAADAGKIALPRIVVDFAQSGLNSVGRISDLVAPHRIFDAILRDSEIDGVAFRKTPMGEALRKATQADASAILEASPASLLFGAWNSTGEGGGMGAKFARSIVSEIIGVGCPVEEITDRRTGEVTLRTGGRRTGSRIDPLGIVRSVEVYSGDAGWGLSTEAAGKGAKRVRPSEINHGNIAPSVDVLGVTCDYCEQTSVISLAGLRRLSFSGRSNAAKDKAGRAYLAALGLLALAEGDRNGLALRSRCDLVCDGIAPLQMVKFDGSTVDVSLNVEQARSLYASALTQARNAGFNLATEPQYLSPSTKLVEIVRQSQAKALDDETDEDQD